MIDISHPGRLWSARTAACRQLPYPLQAVGSDFAICVIPVNVSRNDGKKRRIYKFDDVIAVDSESIVGPVMDTNRNQGTQYTTNAHWTLFAKSPNSYVFKFDSIQ